MYPLQLEQNRYWSGLILRIVTLGSKQHREPGENYTPNLQWWSNSYGLQRGKFEF